MPVVNAKSCQVCCFVARLKTVALKIADHWWFRWKGRRRRTRLSFPPLFFLNRKQVIAGSLTAGAHSLLELTHSHSAQFSSSRNGQAVVVVAVRHQWRTAH